MPRTFETRIPPPIVLLIAASLMWALARLSPAMRLAWPGAGWLAAILAVLGLALNLVPKWWFGRAGTTVNPLRPQAVRHLVVTGPYRFSRNPMYLGHVLLLLAWACSLGHPLALTGVVLYLAWVTCFQIRPEERVLARRFPDAYRDYRRRVRRWL
ncbi:methyltransferase family protein [Pseudoxanthomonas beigongshangi]